MRKKHEYKTCTIADYELDAHLAKMGEEGWRLVSAQETEDQDYDCIVHSWYTLFWERGHAPLRSMAEQFQEYAMAAFPFGRENQE